MKTLFVRLGLWVALLVLCLWSFGPVLIIIISSFKLDRDIFTYVPKMVFMPVIDNYVSLLAEWPAFWRALSVSLTTTGLSVVVVSLIALPAAYAYSRLSSRGLSRTALFLIVVRMFPPIVITIPLFPVFRSLGITDSIFSLVPLYAVFTVSLSVLLLKSFIDTVPCELDEAAWIDGCGRLRSFFLVLIPVIAPGIIASVIFTFLFAWNDFVFAFLFTGNRMKTAPVIINEMLGLIGEGPIRWGTVFAASTVQLVPVLVFIWLVQKRLLSGFTLGAVKE